MHSMYILNILYQIKIILWGEDTLIYLFNMDHWFTTLNEVFGVKYFDYYLESNNELTKTTNGRNMHFNLWDYH